MPDPLPSLSFFVLVLVLVLVLLRRILRSRIARTSKSKRTRTMGGEPFDPHPLGNLAATSGKGSGSVKDRWTAAPVFHVLREKRVERSGSTLDLR